MDARTIEAIAAVRSAVPEFEETFQTELREEDGELGPIQAMSLFARWTADRMRCEGVDDDAVQRAFTVVERLIADPELELGDAVAAEFVEYMWDVPSATELMGARTRERARRRT